MPRLPVAGFWGVRAQGHVGQCWEETRRKAGLQEGHLSENTVQGNKGREKGGGTGFLPQLGWFSSAPYFPQPRVWIHFPVQMDRRAPIPSQGLYLGG